MKFEELILDKNNSILKVLEHINKNGKGIIFITDKGKFAGVVTDGDIRRFLLSGGTTSEKVENLLNTESHYLYLNHDISKKVYLNKNNISSVPIVNFSNEISEIYFEDGTCLYPEKSLQIPVVIMAGGKGSRLFPYTQILPKPLIPIGNLTITEHIINNFKQFGCQEYHMIVNYKKEFIKTYFRTNDEKYGINFIDETEFLGTAGGLKLLKNVINSTFFMSNCDVLIEGNYSEMLDYHIQNKNIITLICANKQVHIPYGTVETDINGIAKRFTEKPEIFIKTNTGMYIIEPDFLNEIPDNTFIHITDVIKKCIAKNLRVGTFMVDEDSWMDMGQINEMNEMIKKKS